MYFVAPDLRFFRVTKYLTPKKIWILELQPSNEILGWAPGISSNPIHVERNYWLGLKWLKCSGFCFCDGFNWLQPLNSGFDSFGVLGLTRQDRRHARISKSIEPSGCVLIIHQTIGF